MRLNLQEDETDKYIKLYQNYLEDVQTLNIKVNDILNEIIEQSRYDKLQRLISNIIDTYNDTIVNNIEKGVFTTWQESSGSLRACLKTYHAGESADAVCVQIEQQMNDLLHDILKIEKSDFVVTDRPIISESDIEILEKLCIDTSTQVEDLSSNYISMIYEKTEENDIYGTLKPFVIGISSNMKEFFEISSQEFKKLHEFVKEMSLKMNNIAEENINITGDGEPSQNNSFVSLREDNESPSARENTSSNEENTSSNEENISSDEENMSSDEENMGSDEENMSSDEENMSSDEENMSSDEENISSNEENISSDEENMSSNEENISFDEENISSDEENISSDEENMSSDEENMSSDEENISSDEENMSSDEENMNSNEENMSSDEENMSSDEENMSSDEENMSSDEENMNFDEKNIHLLIETLENIIGPVGEEKLNRLAKEYYNSLMSKYEICSKNTKANATAKTKHDMSTSTNIYGRYNVTNKSIKFMEPIYKDVSLMLDSLDKSYKKDFEKKSEKFYKEFDEISNIIHEISTLIGIFGFGGINFFKTFSADNLNKGFIDLFALASNTTNIDRIIHGGSLLVKLFDWAMPHIKKSKSLAKLNEKFWNLTRKDIQNDYYDKKMDNYMMEHYEIKYGYIQIDEKSLFYYFHRVVSNIKDDHQRRTFENSVFSADTLENYTIAKIDKNKDRAIYLGACLILTRSAMCSQKDIEASTANSIVDKLYNEYKSHESITPRVDIDIEKRILG